ncbi:hypothetical protein [Mesorhizobium sp.]|jgi:hypothetical protein|uniref:hypothetical protein n=1 Tax=Mesorhizobium sp. TaxID=1871066 RepID=UPI003569E2DD
MSFGKRSLFVCIHPARSLAGCSANLLLLQGSFGVYVDELIGPNNTMMDDIGPARILDAHIGNHRLPIHDAATGGPLDTRYLPLRTLLAWKPERQSQ